jgi:hypothetical protein
MRSWLSLALLLALALPATAGARSWTVAGPTPKGLSVVVVDRPGATCVVLRDRGRLTGESCGGLRPPAAGDVDSVTYAGGATGTAVAVVDVEFADGARQRIDTVDGSAYTGRLAGKLRFFVADLAEPADRVWLVRRYAADGRLLGADSVAEPPVVRAPRTIARGRGWRLSTDAVRELDPLPDQLDREVVEERLVVARGGETLTYSPFAELPRAIDGFSRPLPDGRLLLAGRLGPGVASLRVTYGSGRRAAARTDGRTFFALVPRTEAVRRLEALDGAGATVASLEPRIAPRLPGALLYGWLQTRLPEPAVPKLAFGGGAAALLEVGPWVCLEVGAWRETEDELPCGRPPLGPRDQLMVAGADGTIAGLVHPDVARVEGRSVIDGATRSVATEPAPGRWAAYARVFALPTRNDVDGLRFFDAAGHRVGPTWGAPIFALRDRTRRPRLAGGPLRGDRDCVFLGELAGCDAIDVLASCRARRLAVAVQDGRRVRVVTSDGRARPARRAGRWWVFVAPRGLGVRAVRWSGGGRRLGAVAPVGRECGYVTTRASGPGSPS